MSYLLPNGKQQFTDNNGKPLVNGKVYHYLVGTDTPKDTFQDAGLTIPNTNPIILNARGEASIYGQGNYRQVLEMGSGVLIWDQVIVDPGPDRSLREDLANPAAGFGADLVAYSPSQTVGDRLDQLSSNTGGSIVGLIQTGTGAVPYEALSWFRTWVFPEQFGAVGDGVVDDSAALNKALDRAAGGVLRLTPGRAYRLNSALLISSNTVLDARGAVLTRGAAIDNLIRNKSDGVTGGYGANSNITILGGTWDGNSAGFGGTPCTIAAFGHCAGIKIFDGIWLHDNIYHHIEINGCTVVEIAGNRFSGGVSRLLATNEAVQIDLNVDMSQFPWFGPADSTVCTDVDIHDNVFIDVGTACGSHSFDGSARHGNIRFHDNHVSGPAYAGVTMLNWTDSKIIDNRFERGYYGVLHTSAGTALLRSNIISRNTFYDVGNTGYSGSASRAIFCQQDPAGAHQINGLSIDQNHVLDMVTVGKSQVGISVNYCSNIHIADNVVRNIRQGGIMLFQTVAPMVLNNLVEQSNVSATGSQWGIGLAGTTVRANVDGNLTDTMGILNQDRTIVQNNIVSTASGLSASGNTNTTIGRNLVGTVFA